MGQYFLIANPAKKQYVDPGRLGLAQKHYGLFQGLLGRAIALLVRDDQESGGPTGLLGSWVGDPVVAAGDDAGRPNPGGIRTSSDSAPRRNLNQMAREEYEDITVLVAMMLAHAGHADGLAKVVLEDQQAAQSICPLVFSPGCIPLQHALERLNPRWQQVYKIAREGGVA